MILFTRYTLTPCQTNYKICLMEAREKREGRGCDGMFILQSLTFLPAVSTQPASHSH